MKINKKQTAEILLIRERAIALCRSDGVLDDHEAVQALIPHTDLNVCYFSRFSRSAKRGRRHHGHIVVESLNDEGECVLDMMWTADKVHVSCFVSNGWEQYLVERREVV